MKKFFWKRAANLLLAALLVLSAIPVTAFAEENSSGKLRDIAGESHPLLQKAPTGRKKW